MKKILLSILFLFAPLGTIHASSYVNPDGSVVSIDVKGTIPNKIYNAVIDEIDGYLPTEFDTGSIDYDSGSFMDPHNWEYTFQVKKVYGDKNITSLLINMYQYTGWAHGISWRIGIVYNNKTWEKIELDDLYDTEKLVKIVGPVWEKKISKELEKIYETSLDTSDTDWIKEWTNDISDFGSFTINARNITFYGQEYQHNPYAFGTRTLTYQLIKLKNIKK